MSNVILQGVTLQELNQNLLNGIDERIYDLTKKSKKEPIEYWTRNEMAEKLSISLPTLHDWMNKGILKAYRIGNRVYFKSSEVDQCLKPINQ